MFSCNLPPALLAELLGSFTCHCRNTGGGTDTEKESAHKVKSGEGNSPAAPAGIRTRNLSITSPALLPTSYSGSLLHYNVLSTTYGYLRTNHTFSFSLCRPDTQAIRPQVESWFTILDTSLSPSNKTKSKKSAISRSQCSHFTYRQLTEVFSAKFSA